MALSFEFFSGNGSLKDYTIPFPWIFNGHLSVWVDGTQKFEPADWSVAGSLMTFVVAPPTGTDNIYVARVTPDTARLVDFVNGGGINEAVMDKDSNQIFYLEQEMIDRTAPPVTSGVDDGKFLRTTTLGALQWYDLFGGANTWTGVQNFPTTPVSTSGFQFNSGSGNVNLGATVKLDITDSDGLRFNGSNIFSRANTWAGTQWFQGACTFAGTHTFDPSAVLNISNAAGLQIAGINIFNRSNTWANTNDFTGTVSLGHTTVPTSKTFNVVDSGGLRVSGTSIFARLNTWSADQDFDGALKIGGTDIFARANAWTGLHTWSGVGLHIFGAGSDVVMNGEVTCNQSLNISGASSLQIGGTSIFARANTWTEKQTFNNALGVETQWTNDTGGNAGPETRLNRFTTTAPSGGDKAAFLSWYHTVSTLGQSLIGNLMMVIDDVTAASVDSHFELYTKINNVNAIRLKVGPGVAVGSSQATPQEGYVNAIGYEVLGTALPVQERFVSSLQTITSAGPLTLAHGFGVEPKALEIVLECVTAEQGYSTGDRVHWLTATGHDTLKRASAFWFDATNIYVRYSNWTNVFTLAHKTTGVCAIVTNANWKMEVRALA